MQVPKGGVVESVENSRWHGRQTANADVPLRLAGGGPGDKGVRHRDHRTVAGRQVGKRCPQDRRVGAVGSTQGVSNACRVEIRHWHDETVAHPDRPAHRGHLGADVQARGLQHPGAESEAHRGVVVAAGEDHRGAGRK